MKNSLENKKIYKSYLDAIAFPGQGRFETAVEQYFQAEATINVVHPFNKISGSADYLKELLQPLMQSFQGLYRRDYILMAGSYKDEDWVSSTGYYAGKFVSDWLGIKASGNLAYLRVGEFHRIQSGKAIESYIFFDIPEFMMAHGQWPLIQSPGYCGYLPGPASSDGINLNSSDPKTTQKSTAIVEEMLMKLNTPDEAWRPYWHENMLWYGPAAFGSYIGVEDFSGFQVPFENAFEGWSGGMSKTSPTRHFTRYSDGIYTCSGGWPSLSGTHVKPYLGLKPTNKMVTMRVCDWWRRDGELLVENWVFVDIPDLLQQLGYDLFAELKKI